MAANGRSPTSGLGRPGSRVGELDTESLAWRKPICRRRKASELAGQPDGVASPGKAFNLTLIPAKEDLDWYLSQQSDA